jgi:hypothetical protein
MDVLILAAGLGSRLSKYTFDIIPKYLVNIDSHTGLYHLIKYWNKYANNIFLVIHSKYNLLTNFYIKNILYEYNDKIKIINYDYTDGTAYTINYLLNNNLKRYGIVDNLLITWCDIYPNGEINFNKIKKTKNKNEVYIFTCGNECRYGLIDNKVSFCPNSDGNIVGIYYIQNYKNFNLDEECKNNDIVNYLDKIGNINEYKLENVNDYGDENKYLNSIIKKNENEFNCRFFNKIELMNENTILKKSVNEKGDNIIKYEKGWYLNIHEKKYDNITFIPKVYKYYEYGYLMEYKKNYVPLYLFLNNEDNKITKNNILKNIIEKLNILHKLEKKSINKINFFNDIKKEIYDKVILRRNIIQDFLDYFGNIEYVNSIKVSSFDKILEKCKNIIINYYEALDCYEYEIIFGDCNFSNILINPINIDDIIFIDPRGYFGDSKIYGLKEYDFGKILYGISGYDKFNMDNYFINNINLESKSINFKIESIEYDRYIINKYFNKVHKAFMVINWLSLAEYNKNNIWKCLVSYYYGLYLGTIL